MKESPNDKKSGYQEVVMSILSYLYDETRHFYHFGELIHSFRILKDCLTMTCKDQPTNYYLHLWFSIGILSSF